MKRFTTSRPHALRSVHGFTLIEVLMVVTIIGIAGAIVVPHMLSAGTLGVQAAARHVIADILYAQNDAIVRQKSRKVVFNPLANSYQLEDENGILHVDWKGGGSGASNYIVSFADDSRFEGIIITNVDFGSGSKELEFDDLGGPVSGGTLDITFKTFTYRITVAQFTGRVSVAQI